MKELLSLDDVVNSLSNIKDQGTTAELICSDESFFDTKEGNVGQKQILQFKGIFKTSSDNVKIAALKLLIYNISQNINKSKIIDPIINELFEEISNFSVSPIIMPSKMYELGKVCFHFFRTIIKAKFPQKIVDGNVFSGLMANINLDIEFNIEYLRESLLCVKNIAKYESQKMVVFEKSAKSIQTLIANLLDQKWVIKHLVSPEDQIILLHEAFSIIHYLVVHSQQFKSHFITNDILAQIELFYNLIIADEDKYSLIRLFTDLEPVNDQKLSDTLSRFLPRLIKFGKTTKNDIFLTACLGGLRNFTCASTIPTIISAEIVWIAKFINHSNLNIVEHSLVVIGNILLKEKLKPKSVTQHIIKSCFALLQKNDLNPIYPISVLVNLSMDDNIAQMICADGETELFSRLNELSLTHTNKQMQQEALNLMRNLLIDSQSCQSVQSLALPQILDDIHFKKQSFRLEKMEIIRNLLLQHESSFCVIYKDPAFLFELKYCLSSSDDEIQKVSLDIVEFLVSMRSKNPTYANDLLYEDIISVISINLTTGHLNPTIKKRYSKLLLELNEHEGLKQKQDPWDLIKTGWTESDALFNRIKPKLDVFPELKIKSFKKPNKKPKVKRTNSK
jgi:hypothetical protein